MLVAVLYKPGSISTSARTFQAVAADRFPYVRPILSDTYLPLAIYMCAAMQDVHNPKMHAISHALSDRNEEVLLPLLGLHSAHLQDLITNQQPQPLRRRRTVQHKRLLDPILLPRRNQRLPQCKQHRRS